MNLKIRKYEMLLVLVLGLIAVIRYTLQSLDFLPIYTDGFLQYLSAHPDANVNVAASLFIPRMVVVILLMMVYFWINLFTIPQVRRANYRSFLIYPWVLFQLLVLSYLIAIGVNFASWYAHPAWNNYGEFSLFALFGYNEKPLADLWAGYGMALILISLYGVYATFREYLIYRVEHSGPKSKYRILIANQATIALCIFLLLPTVVASFNMIHDEGFFRAYFVFVPAVICVYTSNTYWIFPRFASLSIFSVRVIGSLIISTAICAFPYIGLLPRLGISIGMWPVNWFIQLIVVTPITWMLYLLRKDKILELRGAEMALYTSRADLQFLRSQINPHFLFNALNTLYGTALIDGSKRTANGIQMLGDMMRFMLDDNHLDFIPLSKEISYLNNYISLQKLRIQASDDIDITAAIEVDDCPRQVIPMLLIPFVENAFKHGIDGNQKSWIHIRVACDDQRIHLNIRNSLHAEDAHNPEKKHSGIGLQNVKKRLNLFYEGKHTLTCAATEQEYIVDLMIEPKTIGNGNAASYSC